MGTARLSASHVFRDALGGEVLVVYNDGVPVRNTHGQVQVRPLSPGSPTRLWVHPDDLVRGRALTLT